MINKNEFELQSKKQHSREESKEFGFTGDICSECGNFTMVRNGTCLRCVTCGSTTGCS